MSAGRSRFNDVVRREWWVVALTLVVALVVGAIMALNAATSYTGSATVTVVPGTLTRFPALATSEQVLAAVTTDTFYEKAAAETNVAASTLKANTKSYLVGSPAKQLVVEYTGTDSAEAKRVALVLAGLVTKEAQALSATETDRMKVLVDETQAAIDKINSYKITGNPWESSDVVYKLWNAQTELTGYQANLAQMLGAYVAPTGSSVSEVSALSSSFKTLLASGLVGLVLGVAIAAVREALLLRRANA